MPWTPLRCKTSLKSAKKLVRTLPWQISAFATAQQSRHATAEIHTDKVFCNSMLYPLKKAYLYYGCFDLVTLRVCSGDCFFTRSISNTFLEKKIASEYCKDLLFEMKILMP